MSACVLEASEIHEPMIMLRKLKYMRACTQYAVVVGNNLIFCKDILQHTETNIVSIFQHANSGILRHFIFQKILHRDCKVWRNMKAAQPISSFSATFSPGYG